MVNEFGKELRKIRIDHGEVLKNMADKLKMTASYLSAIECGKRNIPEDLILKLKDIYKLDEKKVLILKEAKEKCANKVEINFMNTMTKLKRDLALEFARKFDTIDDDFAEKLMEFMKKHKEEED